MGQTKGSSQTKPQTSNLSPQTSSSLARHQRLCTICRHPDRCWIEQDFLHWMSPGEIASHYNLPDRLTVYRHAHATGLFALRKRNLRSALEFVIESADGVQPTAAGLVRVIRAYTRVTDDGEWIDTPKRVIFSHETIPFRRGKDVPSEPLAFEPRDLLSPSTLDPPARSIQNGERSRTISGDVEHSQNRAELALSGAEGAPEAAPSRRPSRLDKNVLPACDELTEGNRPGRHEQSDAPSSVQLPGSSLKNASSLENEYEFAAPLTPLARKVARMNEQLHAARSRAEGGGSN